MALTGLGRHEEAAKEFSVSRELNPGFEEPFSYMVVAMDKQGKNSDALSTLTNLVAKRPQDPLVQEALCLVLTQLGRKPEAIKACEEAIALKPTRAKSYLIYSAVLIGLRRQADAVAAMREAVGLDPRDEVMRRMLSEMEARLAADKANPAEP